MERYYEIRDSGYWRELVVCICHYAAAPLRYLPPCLFISFTLPLLLRYAAGIRFACRLIFDKRRRRYVCA